MKTENLSTLKIYKLTKEQYESRVASGDIDEHAIYLTPDEKIDLSPYATKEELNTKANSSHTHDDRYYTESEIDALLNNKADLVLITTAEIDEICNATIQNAAEVSF